MVWILRRKEFWDKSLMMMMKVKVSFERMAQDESFCKPCNVFSENKTIRI